MCYRCKNCNNVVPHGLSMRKHTIYRKKVEQYGEGTRELREIAAELPVCEECAPKMLEGDFHNQFGQ